MNAIDRMTQYLALISAAGIRIHGECLGPENGHRY
jgi:hypothetical protein